MAELIERVVGLEKDVGALKDDMQEVKADVKRIVALVERGKGAFWLALFLSGSAGAGVAKLVGWLQTH